MAGYRTRTVGPSALSDAVRDILEEERDGLAEVVEEVVADTTERLRKTVRARAKSSFGGTGEYARGWTKKTERKGMDSHGRVYNSGRDASLAHLLEYGHAIVVNAGSPPGNRPVNTGRRVKGRKHIEPAFDDAVSYMDGRLSREV